MRSQYLMRARVVAQGLTVLAMMSGAFFGYRDIIFVCKLLV